MLSVNREALIAEGCRLFVGDVDGIHGLSHWLRVERHGHRLAAATGAAPDFITCFALVHDVARRDDGRDVAHGRRAALMLPALRGRLFDCDDETLARLAFACRLHTFGGPRGDLDTWVCWDADRLDLWRCGIQPDPALLHTAAARDRSVIEEARRFVRENYHFGR